MRPHSAVRSRSPIGIVPPMMHVLASDGWTPVTAYAALRRAADGPSYLLESAPTGGERWGRYSILGVWPRRVLTMDLTADGASIEVRDGGAVRTVPLAGALGVLRGWTAIEGRADPDLPRVADGAVGYLSYDLVHALEPVGTLRGPRRLAHFLDDATVVIFDGLRQTLTVRGPDADRALAVLTAATTPLHPLPLPDRALRPEQVTPSADDATYALRVERAKRYIEAGDVFQVVLARTFTVPRRPGTDPFDAYRALRVQNPSPYLYYLDLPDSTAGGPVAICGASPETLVRVEDGVVVVRPIAGTRPRGRSESEDAALADELLADPKERAEHVMLVDLGRNDVGRVSQVGTVRVASQMVVERFSHVMHLTSEVHGTLAPGKDAWDVLAATFPAGTLSGAPKVRAMQIIGELEGGARGVYGGAIGYVGRNGTADFAIAIRTLVAYPDRFEVGAGAGIVEASDPLLEAAETRHKASAALAAIAAAEAQRSREGAEPA